MKNSRDILSENVAIEHGEVHCAVDVIIQAMEEYGDEVVSIARNEIIDDLDNKLMEEIIKEMLFDQESCIETGMPFNPDKYIKALNTTNRPIKGEILVSLLHKKASEYEAGGIDDYNKGNIHNMHTNIDIAKSFRTVANILDGAQAT